MFDQKGIGIGETALTQQDIRPGAAGVPSVDQPLEGAGPLFFSGGEFSAVGGQVMVETDRAVESLHEAHHFHRDGDWSRWDLLCVQVGLRIDAEGVMWSEVKNTTSRDLCLKTISVRFDPRCFHHAREASQHHQLIHSQNFSDPSGVKPMHVPTTWGPVDGESFLVTVYSSDDSGQALLVGAIPPFGGCFTSIRTLHERLHMQGAFGFEVRFDFRQQVLAGQQIRTPGLLFAWGEGGEELLEQYGARLGNRLARKPKPTITGWNSWDYYQGAIERRHVDENRRACRDLFGEAVSHVIIDEGWERAWGVWEPNWKFPQGLADFCRDAKQAGFVPGIWTAPLMCGIYTPLYFEHPDWFARDARGNVHIEMLSYGQMAILDITHPQAREHLKAVYRRLRGEGFEYFKCDFTQLALNAERFHDSSVGRGQIVRMTFDLIRECIGADAYLLACGAPYESVLGIADANRISGDIHTHWGHIRYIVRSLAARCWMSHATTMDPDFLVVRSAQTSDDPHPHPLRPEKPEQTGAWWMTGRTTNLEEAKVMALAICLCGGDVVLSDALRKLNAEGIAVIKTCLEAKLPPARVVNLFAPGQEEAPVLVSQRDGCTVVGLFNLADFPCSIRLHDFLPLPGGAAHDFWTGKEVPFDPHQPINLPPRSARGLRFKG